MKRELLDFWSVLDFNVTGMLDVDLPGECSIRKKELDSSVKCANNYLQSIIVPMPILMYVQIALIEMWYNEMFTWRLLCGFHVIEILCILING